MYAICQGFSGGSEDKESACNTGVIGDRGLILESGRSPAERNDNPLQYSAWEIPLTEEPGTV